jgi:hypothetical protein
VKDEQYRFLSVMRQAPARLTAEQTAWLINCQPHDLPVLVSARLLKPLGNPPSNGIKFYSAADVLELSKDRAWLTKVSNVIYQHWHRHNARKKERIFPGDRESAATEFPSAAAA